jgi:hypothetical protein
MGRTFLDFLMDQFGFIAAEHACKQFLFSKSTSVARHGMDDSDFEAILSHINLMCVDAGVTLKGTP